MLPPGKLAVRSASLLVHLALKREEVVSILRDYLEMEEEETRVYPGVQSGKKKSWHAWRSEWLGVSLEVLPSV